jgi:hypothetical protein
LTEGFLLALACALVGLALAWVAVRLLVVASPLEIPRLEEVGMSARVFAFSALLAFVTSLVFGVVPALQISGGSSSLREGDRGSRSHRRARKLLVVAEVAISVTLLVGAGLLLRSFLKLLQQDPGFRPESAVVVKVDLPHIRRDWLPVARFLPS